MRQLKEKLGFNRWQRVDESLKHKIKAWVWVVLMVPSYLWWSKSLMWIIFISLYSNYATERGIAEAAKGKEEGRL